MDAENTSHLVEIVAGLKEITALITSATSLAEAVDGMAKAMADLLPAHVRCGIAIVAEGEPATFASDGMPSEVLDEIQHCDGDGPCMGAIRARDIVVSQDLRAEPRWPLWTAAAGRHGVNGVLSYPFDIDTLTLGAVNLYADRPHALTDHVPIIAMLVADHSSLLLRVRREQFSHANLLAQAFDAPRDATVERAIGIVMAQRGCPPEQALRHLHDAATHLGVGLPAVAERLVQTVGDRGTPG